MHFYLFLRRNLEMKHISNIDIYARMLIFRTKTTYIEQLKRTKLKIWKYFEDLRVAELNQRGSVWFMNFWRKIHMRASLMVSLKLWKLFKQMLKVWKAFLLIICGRRGFPLKEGFSKETILEILAGKEYNSYSYFQSQRYQNIF